MINNEKLMDYISSHSMFKNIFVSNFYFPEDNIVHPNDVSKIEEWIQINQQIKEEEIWYTIEKYSHK